MDRTAKAIVLATVLVATSLSVAPAATAGHGDCHQDFNMPDSKPSASNARELDVLDPEIGREDVSASGGDETLHVLLDTDDTLEWTVRVDDPNAGCIEFSTGDCDFDDTYPNTIETQGTEQTCTLDAPQPGMLSCFVEFENAGTSELEYRTWVS